MQKEMKVSVNMLYAIVEGSQIRSGRNRLDVFSDRIRQAGTEPTLLAFAERLQQLMDTPPTGFNLDFVREFVAVCGQPESAAILNWMREYPRIAAMVAGIKDRAQREETAAQIEITPATATKAGTIPERRPFDIGLRVTCLSPLAHGADAKAGNATLFRRMTAITSTGQTISLPFYAGNALRGQVRDLLADHLLLSLGLLPRRDQPPCALWFFHTIYAGGALEENSAATKALNALFGKAQGALRTDGLREFRDMLPAVSALGCALGNRVLCGRAQFGDLCPQCAQWGTGDADVASLMEWTYLTRREDYEGRSNQDEHTGMIATTETLKAGVVLDGGVDIDLHCQPVERAAIARGLLLLQERGRIGAENRRDLGSVEIEFTGMPVPDAYDQFLVDNKARILEFLGKIGAVYAPCESDSEKPATM